MSEGVPPPTPPSEEIPDKVRVTSYPKIIFLWPTWVLSFIIWMLMALGAIDPLTDDWIAWLWFGIFAFNVFIVSFEFTSAKFLLVVLLLGGIVVALIFIPPLLGTTLSLPYLYMDSLFYLAYTILFSVVYLFLWISRRFNYLEITTQQISYHVGLMADERRYPAPNCHFEKRTEDIFERIIPPWCAKLVMKQEGGEEAEILDCVPRINKRLEEIKKILEHIKVKNY